MLNKKNIEIFAYWTTIILIVVLMLEMFNSLDFSGIENNGSFYELSNSDSLALNAYCRDIIGNIRNMLTWNLGTALWFFPNTLLMVLIELFVPQTLYVQVIYGMIQVLLILFLSNYLMRIIYPQISKIYLSISNISLSLFFIYTISYKDFLDFTSNLIVPYHTGAFIGVFICLILLFKYLSTKKSYFLYSYLFISIISNISDGLVSIYLCGPVILTLTIVLFIYKAEHKKEIIRLLFLSIIAFIGSYLLQKKLQPLFNVDFNGLGFITKDNIIFSYNMMTSQYLSYFKAGGIQSVIMYLSALSFLASGVLSLMLLIKKKKEQSSSDLLFFIYFLFTFSFIAITFFAPIILGVYGGFYSIRYNVVLLYLAMLNIGFIIAYIAKIRSLNLYFRISCILILLFSSYTIVKAKQDNPIKVFAKLNNYYPTFIKATDTFAKANHCKYGVGYLWDARYITSISKEKLMVNTVFDSMSPWLFVNNRDRYFWTNDSRKQPVVYNFIVLRTLGDTSKIYKIFGVENIKKVTIDGYSFYKVPDFVFEKETYQLKIVDNQNATLK